MELAAAGLIEQPFRTRGQPLATLDYGSHRSALIALGKFRKAAAGIALLQGPALSGKTTILRETIAALPEDVSAGVLDGTGLDTRTMVESLLRQFGFSVEFDSTTELLGMLRVFVLQQAAGGRPPAVFVENAHAMNPGARRAITELACQRARHETAIKLVLVSDRPLGPLLGSSEPGGTGVRIAQDIHLRPMGINDAPGYLQAKLRAAGSEIPEYIFPRSVCNELWRASGGWPGILDRIALLAFARAETLPVPVDCIERPALPRGTWPVEADEAEEHALSAPPMLFVSCKGELLDKHQFEQSRLLIGRSEHNDIALDSRFVSRHHVLLVRSGNSTIAMDLNSTNGTVVNTRRVSNHILLDNDVIELGNFRIKYSDPYATRRGAQNGSEFADTVIMNTLEDMRALLSEDETGRFPVSAENLPTLGN